MNRTPQSPLQAALPHVLAVDDDPTIRGVISDYLKQNELRVTAVADGRAMQAVLADEVVDLIVLDLKLRGEDGMALARRLRDESEIPIIMLTGRTEEADRIMGLELGADDYLTKPFDKRELIARIHAIVRRAKGHSQSVIKTGKLNVNLDTRTVEANGTPVHLTGKEYGIIELLSLRKGTTLTKEMFLNHLYGGMDEPELKIIDVFICKLRKKLANASNGKNFIETVWGRGYVLREPADDDMRVPAE